MSDLEAVRVLRTASGVPDVVVLPGLGALPYLRPLVRELARHRTVAVLDVPGFRPGPDAPLPTSLPALGEVVYQWVRAHAPDALLLGHSTGAQLALHAAALGAPLRGLALVSTTFAPPSGPCRGRRRPCCPASGTSRCTRCWRTCRRTPSVAGTRSPSCAPA